MEIGSSAQTSRAHASKKRDDDGKHVQHALCEFRIIYPHTGKKVFTVS